MNFILAYNDFVVLVSNISPSISTLFSFSPSSEVLCHKSRETAGKTINQNNHEYILPLNWPKFTQNGNIGSHYQNRWSHF